MVTIFDKVRIRNICKKHDIKNYIINSDCSITVNGNVDISDDGLYRIPLNFKYVSGFFSCRGNNLKSLKGCPESVGSDFHCEFNELPSLEGCPKYVGRSFCCKSNNIKSFEHLPLSVKKFECSNNPIYYIWKLFENYSNIELFNYYDIIQDDVIILDRLVCFLEEVRKEDYKGLIINTFTNRNKPIRVMKNTRGFIEVNNILTETVSIDEFCNRIKIQFARRGSRSHFE